MSQISPAAVGVAVLVSDYQQLAGKTLYFRAAKRHKHETSLYSDIQKARVTLDGRIPDGDANVQTAAKWPELTAMGLPPARASRGQPESAD